MPSRYSVADHKGLFALANVCLDMFGVAQSLQWSHGVIRLHAERI